MGDFDTKVSYCKMKNKEIVLFAYDAVLRWDEERPSQTSSSGGLGGWNLPGASGTDPPLTHSYQGLPHGALLIGYIPIE
jgi:hypothetical protein